MAHLKKYDMSLRPWQISDLSILLKARKDNTITKEFGDISIIECLFPLFAKPLQDKELKRINLAIDISDLIVGGIQSIYSKNTGTIGLWIDRDYRNLGIGTQAVKMFTEEMFRKYNLKGMYAEISKDNIGSIRTFKKAGYFVQNDLIQTEFIEDNKIILRNSNVYPHLNKF
jgi:RimJ/RimL family protein N-acetyltransferase